MAVALGPSMVGFPEVVGRTVRSSEAETRPGRGIRNSKAALLIAPARPPHKEQTVTLYGAGMASTSLVPIVVDPNGAIFEAISAWQFEEEFVHRILTEDVPQRVKYENAAIWAYRDQDKNIVGFGVLSICADYAQFTGQKHHLYIPLLAVHPDRRGLGHGKAIVKHLVDMAACFVQESPGALHNAVFLDVYEDSVNAYNLYLKCDFVSLGDRIFVDPLNGKKYRVMAKRVAT